MAITYFSGKPAFIKLYFLCHTASLQGKTQIINYIEKYQIGSNQELIYIKCQESTKDISASYFSNTQTQVRTSSKSNTNMCIMPYNGRGLHICLEKRILQRITL